MKFLFLVMILSLSLPVFSAWTSPEGIDPIKLEIVKEEGTRNPSSEVKKEKSP